LPDGYKNPFIEGEDFRDSVKNMSAAEIADEYFKMIGRT
jgi:hypothetical protein